MILKSEDELMEHLNGKHFETKMYYPIGNGQWGMMKSGTSFCDVSSWKDSGDEFYHFDTQSRLLHQGHVCANKDEIDNVDL